MATKKATTTKAATKKTKAQAPEEEAARQERAEKRAADRRAFEARVEYVRTNHTELWSAFQSLRKSVVDDIPHDERKATVQVFARILRSGSRGTKADRLRKRLAKIDAQRQEVLKELKSP